MESSNSPFWPNANSNEELQQKARQVALADPEVCEFLANLSYPQAAEVLPGMPTGDGEYATTLEQMLKLWAVMEKDYAHMYGPARTKKEHAEWEAKQTMWLKTRESRRVALELKKKELSNKLHDKLNREQELEDARSKWKMLVAKKMDILEQLDQEIYEAHKQYRLLRIKHGLLR